ncbi:uncharacterized protein LOC114321256 [Camellia sinensis]|uniref:uncharacterized protein LOC114321256 n=1 Tax=Camellia sinensis TaxID=4442 RepID=UPI0010366B37|nr:uncharacterized protein LOC114321256 [Camellia sinensis]
MTEEAMERRIGDGGGNGGLAGEGHGGSLTEEAIEDSALMRFRKSENLSPRFIRPFEILERIGEVAYCFALLPQLLGVHDRFHISMLRKYEPDPSHVLDLVDIEVDEDASYKERLIQILDTREQVLRGKTIPLVKVLWRHHGVKETTW